MDARREDPEVRRRREEAEYVEAMVEGRWPDDEPNPWLDPARRR